MWVAPRILVILVLFLQIAMGIPLHRLKDIRLLYGEKPYGDEPIDFDKYVASLIQERGEGRGERLML